MKYKVGKKILTNSCGICTVIEYRKARDISVMFEDGTIVKTSSSSISKRSIKNPNHPSVYKIGFVGQGLEPKHHKKCYKTWRSMFTRCYDDKSNPTYKECVVHETWHNFQNFIPWYYNNYVKDWELDKDILNKDNKAYGPDACCFVPKSINAFFKRSTSRDLPIGVRKHKNKYRASCTYNRVKKHIGLFYTIEEAVEMYNKTKCKFLLQETEIHTPKLNEKVITTLKKCNFNNWQ